MQSRSFLRLFAPLALASLLAACGDDPAGGSDGDESTAKRDSGIKRRPDAGTKKTTAEDDDDDSDDDDDDDDDTSAVKDAGKKDAGAAKDAGAIKCTSNDDCVPDDEMDGIGCCDIPTKACFVSQEDMCPPPKTTKPTQPPYN